MTSNLASTSSSVADSRQVKLATGLDHKTRGNEAFTKGDMKAALEQYHFAVLYLSGLENRSILGLVGENSGSQGKPEDVSSDEDQDQDQDEANQSQSPQVGSVEQSEKQLSTVYSNMAACYIKQHNYAKAIQVAEKSLKADSKNVKAKYRKAQAMRLGGDLYKAKAYLEETIASLQVKKANEKQAIDSFTLELNTLNKVISDKEAMGRNKWKGFLGKNPSVFHVETDTTLNQDKAHNQTEQTKEEVDEAAATQP